MQLLITDGTLKGKHVLVLDKIKTFDFLGLPAEIRVSIYRYLIQEDSPIAVTAFKLPDIPRRATRQGFGDRKAHSKFGLFLDSSSGKYLNQDPSDFGIARVSKLLASEALPIMYGDNIFEFASMGELDVFLGQIGDMTKYIKHISIRGDQSYTNGKGRGVFDKLLPATNLTSVTINHRAISGTSGRGRSGHVSMQKLVEDARPLLRTLHKAMAARNVTDAHSTTVLDVFHVVKGEMCTSCKNTQTDPSGFHWHFNCSACEDTTSQVRCDDPGIDVQVATTAESLRDAIAAELEIKM